MQATGIIIIVVLTSSEHNNNYNQFLCFDSTTHYYNLMVML